MVNSRGSSEIHSGKLKSLSSEDESSTKGGEKEAETTDDEGATTVLQRRSPNRKNSKSRVEGTDNDNNSKKMSEGSNPVQGSNDDFVHLAHIASIEVKEAPVLDTASSSDKHRKSTGKGSTPVPEEGKRKSGNRDGRARHSTGSSSTRSTRSTAAAVETVAEEDDVETSSDCGPMDTILKSPYEPSQNAEKGIKVFADMKNLLAENNEDSYRSVDPKAAKIFGPTNAWCLVKANGLIDKSGMVYSQEWVGGSIRGNPIGKIPKDLLLLCLVPKRFAKAQELLLAGLVRDLEVYSLVKEALQKWELDDEFKRIAACQKNINFQSKKRDCLKCEIFVARVYSCTKAFSISTIDDDLLAKVKRCLTIMEEHLPDSPSMQQKKRKEREEMPPPPVESNPSVSNKKRRGRPPKSPRVAHDLTKTEQGDSTSQQAQGTEEVSTRDDDAATSRRGASAATTRSRRSASASNGSKSTLASIVSRFEDQHREMGEMYRQMGETLAELKAKIEESREKTEREIRSELLQEVQKTIMSSFPKK